MIIGIDIDNVIADFESKFREKINSCYNLKLKRKDIKKFNFFECTPISKEQEKEAFIEFEKEDGYKKLKIVPCCRQSLNLLSKKNIIILITARPKGVKKDTELWLRRRKIPYNELIFSKNKYLYLEKIDILIEDKWENAYEIAKKGKKVILFDYPWNREAIEFGNIFRVKNWKEALKLIEK